MELQDAIKYVDETIAVLPANVELVEAWTKIKAAIDALHHEREEMDKWLEARKRMHKELADKARVQYRTLMDVIHEMTRR